MGVAGQGGQERRDANACESHGENWTRDRVTGEGKSNRVAEARFGRGPLWEWLNSNAFLPTLVLRLSFDWSLACDWFYSILWRMSRQRQ